MNKQTQEIIISYLNNRNQTSIQFKDYKNSILKLSKHFVDQIGPTPWEIEKSIESYLLYFFPRNYSRFHQVLDRAQSVHFPIESDQLVCIGSGPGVEYFCMIDFGLSFKSKTMVEKSKIASEAHQWLIRLRVPVEPVRFSDDLSKIQIHKSSTAVFSYSINEMTELPKQIYQFQNLVIVEPSLKQSGKKLIELRDRLIQKGFFIWAPCLHQDTCPMQESKLDWCHDRATNISFSWQSELNRLLPMDMNQLPFCYLLASKQPPPQMGNKIRVVGDALKEKGKTKQMICRGSDREFISHLKRDNIAFSHSRGDLIELENQFTKKASELRLIP